MSDSHKYSRGSTARKETLREENERLKREVAYWRNQFEIANLRG